MRIRLIEAAMIVFGERGVEASVIDDITSLAGVSRGTFYNYFQTNEEALRAVSIVVGNELMIAVAPHVESHDDPAERISTGVRLWLMLIQKHPALGRFLSRAGLYVLEQDSRVREDLPRDLFLGIRSGRFTIEQLEIGFMIVAGTVLAAISQITQNGPLPDNGNSVAERILLALGVASEQANEIARQPMVSLDFENESIIRRAEALASARHN